MDFSKIPLFGAMKARMDYLSERQSVLAQNVANADTPGYKAMDVTSPDFNAMANKMMSEAINNNSAQKLPSMPSGHLTMAVTNSQHMHADIASYGNFRVEKRDTTGELNPNGNNVAIEDEMMKVAQNQMEYNKTLNLFHKMITLFNTAVGNTSSS